ncbi:MAG: DNA-binding response regulator [Caldilineae bacterium]|nr:MAG: DNA-binding response regulator [Caldilineae bacterium]
MSKTILLVDDDRLIIETLTYSLQKEGYHTIATGDGLEAVRLEQEEHPDLVVLDIMLPSLDGWEVCRRIRQHSAVPIIMLTARDEEFDRVLGLEMGADDYLPKPFSFRELLARIRATLRRVEYERQPLPGQIITIGDVRVDQTAHQAYKKDTPLTMTQKEYDLLLTLMSRAGQVVSRAELLDKVWGVDWLGDTRTLDVHIRWVREKIEDNPGKPRYIQTVRGVGYRFIAPEELA